MNRILLQLNLLFLHFLKTFPYFCRLINEAVMPSWLKRVTNIEIYCLMENNQQQILSEIKSLMSSVRVQLEQLDAKMAQLQQMYEPQEFDMAPIEMDFDVVPEPVAEPSDQGTLRGHS